ncbi:MAG: hypothetical protein ACLFV6_18800 [Spirulinaceae cyanobacterium]
MKIQYLALLALLTGAIAPPIVHLPQSAIAQVWEPIARYNPNTSANVRLVNQSGFTLLYDMTADETNPIRLAPGGTAQINNLNRDSYVVVYSGNTTEIDSEPVEYDVSVIGNTVNVVIQRASIPPGDHTLHLHHNGGIYVY